VNKKKAIGIAIDGADFLTRMIKPTGRFVYGYKSQDTLDEISGYNVLRHAGSIWAIMCVDSVAPKKEYRKKAKLAIDYMINEYMVDYNGTKMIVDNGYANLGGNGLAILAILKWNTKGSKKYNKIIIDLARYITIYCMDYNGRLTYHKRNVEYNVDKGFTCDFYPGEAVLALCEVSNNMSYSFADEINKIVNYHYNLREAIGTHIRDHWMIQTIESFGMNRWLEYARAIAKEEMKGWPKNKPGPTACRSEALLSYINIEKNKSSMKKAKEHLGKLLKFQASMQVKKGMHKGGFLWSKTSDVLRCDATQHNVCSFLRYSQMK
jgi:hypothetical protein